MNQVVEQIGEGTAALIKKQADANGLSVDDYLKQLMNGESHDDENYDSDLTPTERARLFREWAESHDTNAPPIPLESLRRENLY